MPPKISLETKLPILFPDTMDFQPRTSPCEVHCPAGNPIQKVHALLKEKRVAEALFFLRARNPFPGVTGRVCSHPCERECNRRHYDEALGIRGLERFAADHAEWSRFSGTKRNQPSGSRIAIVGSGPAGMTCAYFSALLGHDVTVLESAPLLGGIPRMAIPDFRLPKDVVDKEIGYILNLGVRAHTNTAVGKDIRFDEIQAEFDAILIAAGCCLPKTLEIHDADSLPSGLAFLREVHLGRRDRIGETVVIIGGGGIAFNCAFTARRLGATRIHIVCLEPDSSMCAFEEDIQRARVEGVLVHNSRMISRILKHGEKTTGIEHRPVSAMAFEGNGRMSLQPSGDAAETLAADLVISAIGLEPDLSLLEGNLRTALAPEGIIAVDRDSLMTSRPGIFAAGDFVTGSSSVAGAIGGGRRAAFAIDRYLRGGRTAKTVRISMCDDGHLATEEVAAAIPPHVVDYEEIMNLDYFEKKKRPPDSETAMGISARSIEEIERGMRMEEAPGEAARCIHCGHCTSCGCCVENCPGFVLAMTPEGPVVRYPDECWHCGCCRIACPSGAVLYEFPLNMLV